MQSIKELLTTALQATIEAQTEVLRQYHQGFEVQTKPDGSPVTSADLAAHHILSKHLQQTGIPILSEEGEHFNQEERQKLKTYWCLDPIDGTMDFVNKTDEFCLCTGLIHNNSAIIGVLAAPALHLFYFAAEGMGSFKYVGQWEDLNSWLNHEKLFDKIMQKSEKLPFLTLPEKYTFLASRFHSDKITENYIQDLRKTHPEMELITFGSAIKLGILAEGRATEYTRMRSVNFWDVAAGHAIAKYAGIKVLQINSTEEINYSDENLRVHGYSLKHK